MDFSASFADQVVLIVEDETDVLELFTIWMEKEGYRVIKASNGYAALQRFMASKPDLVMTDLIMPQMSGLELCRKLRSISQVPILVVSAIPEKESRSATLAAGANDYVNKALGRAELVRRATALLSSKEAQCSSEASVGSSGKMLE